jgi:hypothetical protein
MLKNSGDRASPCFRPFWIGKLSDECIRIRTLLYVSFKHILIKYSWHIPKLVACTWNKESYSFCSRHTKHQHLYHRVELSVLHCLLHCVFMCPFKLNQKKIWFCKTVVSVTLPQFFLGSLCVGHRYVFALEHQAFYTNITWNLIQQRSVEEM